jgi:hypothetical protein
MQPSPKSAAAWANAPAVPLPAPWGIRPVSFLRDIQPVLDKHCTRCHTGLKPAGGLDLGGGLISYDDEVPGYGHNRAFETILTNNLVSLSPARMQDASITPPLAYGSRKSTLMTALSDDTHAKEVNLTGEDRLRLAMWIDANAPYHDRFVNKRPLAAAYDLAADKALLQQIQEVHARRCASCHKPDEITRLDWIDLASPERSLFLTAPLAQSAGGLDKCGTASYADAHDPDYELVYNSVTAAVSKAWANPRRDLMALNRPAQGKEE